MPNAAGGCGLLLEKYMRTKKPIKLLVSVFLFILITATHVVHAACRFVPASGTTGIITFNTIDPSVSPGPILGTVIQQINFRCDNGRAFTVTASPASGWTMTSGANLIPYTPGFVTNGNGQGAASIPLLTNATQILLSNYQNAPAGAYANSQAITLTINCPTCTGTKTIFATIPVGNITGAVINTCAVTQPAGTLTFNIDPSIPGMSVAVLSQDLRIKCTKNDPVAVTATSKCGGAAPMLDSLPACGGFKIPYTFNRVSSATGAGFGAGTDISLGISGSINSINYANAPAGTYSDLETVTITY
jgi:hypothetical protein